MAEETQSRRIAILKEIPLFAALRESQLALLADDLRRRDFARDDVIFRQGDESREVYIILTGRVRIFKLSPGGAETTIDIFSTHDIVGELAALDQLPRSATATAIGPVSLLVIAQHAFIRHLSTIPELSLTLARLLALKLRWTAAYAEAIAQFDAAGRLLHILIQFNERYGRALDGGKQYELDLALNQSDLASMVGARREWVNRIIGEWRRRGLLDFDRGVITILDLPRVIAERDSRTEATLSGDAW
jgi:CRP-like cAMP-binding protein